MAALPCHSRAPEQERLGALRSRRSREGSKLPGTEAANSWKGEDIAKGTIRRKFVLKAKYFSSISVGLVVWSMTAWLERMRLTSKGPPGWELEDGAGALAERVLSGVGAVGWVLDLVPQVHDLGELGAALAAQAGGGALTLGFGSGFAGVGAGRGRW